MTDTKWADIEAEEDFEEGELGLGKVKGFETKPDRHGIKTVTNYTKNIKGETVKVVKRVHVIPKKQRINKEVYARARLPKFGVESEDNDGVVRVNDDYFIEVPKATKNEALKSKNDDEDYYFADLQARPARDILNKFKLLKDTLTDDKEKREVVEEVGTSKYIPPSMRGGFDRAREQQQREECTVRVTNLSEDVKDEDLKELFGAIGRINRIYLAVNKETKSSKGFAFITYFKRSDAEKAIAKLNRHGYDNLVLNVEWAKPSTRDR